MASEGDGPATWLVLVPEWVIGDSNLRIVAGTTAALDVWPPEPSRLPHASWLSADRLDAGLEPAAVYVVDPTYPSEHEVRGTVVSIRALRWSDPPGGPLRLDSSPTVAQTRIDTAVDEYLVEIRGTAVAR